MRVLVVNYRVQESTINDISKAVKYVWSNTNNILPIPLLRCWHSSCLDPPSPCCCPSPRAPGRRQADWRRRGARSACACALPAYSRAPPAAPGRQLRTALQLLFLHVQARRQPPPNFGRLACHTGERRAPAVCMQARLCGRRLSLRTPA